MNLKELKEWMRKQNALITDDDFFKVIYIKEKQDNQESRLYLQNAWVKRSRKLSK